MSRRERPFYFIQTKDRRNNQEISAIYFGIPIDESAKDRIYRNVNSNLTTYLRRSNTGAAEVEREEYEQYIPANFFDNVEPDEVRTADLQPSGRLSHFYISVRRANRDENAMLNDNGNSNRNNENTMSNENNPGLSPNQPTFANPELLTAAPGVNPEEVVSSRRNRRQKGGKSRRRSHKSRKAKRSRATKK